MRTIAIMSGSVFGMACASLASRLLGMDNVASCTLTVLMSGALMVATLYQTFAASLSKGDK